MSDLISKIPHWLERCPEGVRELLLRQLEIVSNSEDLELFIEYLENTRTQKYPKISLDTFLNSPVYLGIGAYVYPEIRKIIKEILSGKYLEAVVVCGIGAGKTLASNIITCYKAHELLCLKDPHMFFHLIPDKPIGLINMGTTATQALEVGFSGIKRFVETSPWFQGFNPHMTQGKIRFPEKNILIMSGNSKSTTPLGHNIYNATLDEAAFFMDTERKQVAEDIYMALQRRIISRFKEAGLLVMISSPQYENDFVMRRLKEAERADYMYSVQLPTWKLKPYDKEQETFWFDSRKNELLERLPEAITGGINKLHEAFDVLQNIWEIPREYKRAFIQDPDKAKRDFAAVPSKAIQAFLPNWEVIQDMFTEEESPLQIDGTYKFPEAPLRANYYIHIDLALNVKGKGDYAGMSMVHFDGYTIDKETGEKRKKIKVDLAERIKAGASGEIEFSDIRNKVYELKRQKFLIKKVTFDSWNSRDSVQIFRSKGIRAELLSVDRTVEPYQLLKELIYERRIKCHKMPVLAEELFGLEITKANKVDHTPSSSKDVADSLAGAVFSCLSEEGFELGVQSGYTSSDISDLEKSEKEKYYENLQDMLEQGLIN